MQVRAIAWHLAAQRPPTLTLSAGRPAPHARHAGMATKEHTPKGRGYDSALTYFNYDTDLRVAASAKTLLPPARFQLQACT